MDTPEHKDAVERQAFIREMLCKDGCPTDEAETTPWPEFVAMLFDGEFAAAEEAYQCHKTH